MSAMHLVVQGGEVATGDLKSLARLARAEAIERVNEGAFRLTCADPGTKPVVAAHCANAGLDFGFVAAGRRFADFRLLAMDMDSTLITIECIDEIADFAGRKAEVAAVTAAAMRGEIDWPQSLGQRVAVLAGLDASVLERVYRERLRLTPGAEALLAAARLHGVRTLLVSGGFTFFTDRLRAELGLDYAYANRLVIGPGAKLAGAVDGPLVDAGGKARHLARVRAELGLGREQVLAIGDGANDLPMLSEAGTSIAYHAKPVVQASTSYALNHSTLAGVLSLFPA
jgi:phosphoserine phosphatase